MPHPHYVDLTDADLPGLVLPGADLEGVLLKGANLEGADLRGANLFRADLSWTNLVGANLSHASIVEASLAFAQLAQANLRYARVDGCRVYGVSAWEVDLEEASQTNLWFTTKEQNTITIDGLETAQFLCLLLDNRKLRTTIDSLALKAVLILGRFTETRKKVLEAIRSALRQHGYVPLMFDFEKPSSRNYTETVSTLAHLCRFIIADITDARVVLQELERTVPHLPSVPVQPILDAAFETNVVLSDMNDYPSFLPTFRYQDESTLLSSLQTSVIAPAEARVSEIHARRATQGRPTSR
jgi:hypothetical protein